MENRFIIYLVMLFFWDVVQVNAEPLAVDIHAQTAIVMNADTGAILYAKDPHRQMFPASITKIATCLYTLERSGANLDAITVAEQDSVGFVTEAAKKRSNYSLPSHYLEFGATHMTIHRGERLSLRDLLYGMMVQSADDASNVIAQHVGGSIPRFMKSLNSYLLELGLKSTHFTNPHGLHHPDHMTTAYDMAILTREALKSAAFREIVSTTHYKRPKTEKQAGATLVQGNRLLRRGKHRYDKAIGVKTGYTSKAQKTLVAAAEHKGRTLIAVVLYNEDRDQMYVDVTALFEAAFQQPLLERQLLPKGPLAQRAPVEGTARGVRAALTEPLKLRYYPAEETEIVADIEWESLELPIGKGQKLGHIVLHTPEGRELKRAPLVAERAVSSSVVGRLGASLRQGSIIAWLAVIAVAGILFLVTRSRFAAR